MESTVSEYSEEPQLSSIQVDKDPEESVEPRASSFEQNRIRVCLEFNDFTLVCINPRDCSTERLRKRKY